MEPEVEEVPFDLPPIYPECPSWLSSLRRDSPDSRQPSIHASSGKGHPYLVFYLKRHLLKFWYENNCLDEGRLVEKLNNLLSLKGEPVRLCSALEERLNFLTKKCIRAKANGRREKGKLRDMPVGVYV